MAEKPQKKKVSRTAVKKVKDKWKAKQWYTVRSPPMYNAVAIAETLADETDKLMGRVAEATLQDLTGDFSKMHVKMRFKIAAVRGNECATKFAGHELTSDYVRRLTRRKHSKIDTVVDVTTQDGFQVRVKPMAVTDRRAQTTQEQEIRRITAGIVQAAATSKDHAAFVKEIVNGELAQAIYREARKIYPLKRVEIRKSEIVAEPAAYFETVDLFAAPPKPEPEPTEEEAETPAPAEEAPVAEGGEASPEETGQVSEEEQL